MIASVEGRTTRRHLARKFVVFASIVLLSMTGLGPAASAADGKTPPGKAAASAAKPAGKGAAKGLGGRPLVAYAARIAGDEVRTRVVIDFDHKPTFKVHYLDGPQRIVIDLPDTVFGFKPGALAARGVFTDIRYGSMERGAARLVMTAKRPTVLALSEVQKDEKDRGYRLVLDAKVVPQETFETQVKAGWADAARAAGERHETVDIAPHVKKSTFIVAVDAGHGGIDAGATGARTKTPEKTITLAFAKTLADRLNRNDGIHAFLTRKDDEFVSLSGRVAIAREHDADLFISIHADTLSIPTIRGATVYTISDKSSDRMAADLAERENKSDTIAGVDFNTEPPEVSDILLDLTRRETQAFSVTMANAVVSAFEGQIGLINNPHRYAGFQVLTAPDVPSILLELGFLSNKDDEQQLLDEKWREKVANRLAEAVSRYRHPLVANGG
nr:N-acetylmuramoyl-L-alanine amidase [Rhizobium halophytocola]